MSGFCGGCCCCWGGLTGKGRIRPAGSPGTTMGPAGLFRGGIGPTGEDGGEELHGLLGAGWRCSSGVSRACRPGLVVVWCISSRVCDSILCGDSGNRVML